MMFRIPDYSLKMCSKLTVLLLKKTKVSYNVTKCVLKMAIKFWILKKQYGPLKLFSCIVHSKFSGFEQKK